jgi:hypothetical protein
MLSAAADGPAVNVCGSSAAGVSFSGMGALLTSLALSGVPAGREGGGRGFRVGYFTGAGVLASLVGVTSVGDSALRGAVVSDLGLRYGVARQQYH